ncbi:alpha/beta fold hydrolase [Eubacterium sp.]|uniref:alpha/beta fold hydrolase n=1 Tax=Eubacterium sp. TaxID=142586 RepID=UPI00261E9DEC|nr:alpha/beta fold hydrolase [Eubacterium sp.]MDD7331895.1 alpha/beta fold hydrolase [Eubacterium sp.]
MKKYTEKIASTDSKNNLNVIIWETEKEPIGVLQIVHGMAEYIDRYDNFAKYMTEHGFNVIGHDHLGHGHSVSDERDYGFFAEENGDKIIIEDMHSVTQYAREKWEELPNFILGHSMGSFCLRQYLTKYSNDVFGAIIMGTGWIPSAAALLGKTIATNTCKSKGSHTVNPLLIKLTLEPYNKPFAPARTNCDWLSRDEKQVDLYVNDKLCGFDFTAGAYKDFFTVLEKIAKNRQLIGMRKSLPILITSGSVDPVGGKKACEKLNAQYKRCGIDDVTLKLWENDRHEILNELDKSDVYRYICNWLKSKIQN